MKRWELGDARAGFASHKATSSMGHASLTTTAQRFAATKASPEATVLGSVTAAFALGTVKFICFCCSNKLGLY